MSPLPKSLFQPSPAQQVETFLVKMPDGKIVARTADELAALPPDLRAQLLLLSPQG